MFIDELKHFLDCVNGEALPLVDLRDGVRSLALSLAAQHSLLTGYAVEMSDI
jgi:predicted dehydrogenase